MSFAEKEWSKSDHLLAILSSSGQKVIIYWPFYRLVVKKWSFTGQYRTLKTQRRRRRRRNA